MAADFASQLIPANEVVSRVERIDRRLKVTWNDFCKQS